MRQALCHVPIPGDDAAVERTLAACFASLTGKEPRSGESFGVARFARGGMSSGMVCGETWTAKLLPRLRQRAQWLRAVWECER